MKKIALFLVAFLIGTTSLFAQTQDPNSRMPGGEIPEKQENMNQQSETFGDQGGSVPCPPGAFDDKGGSGLDDTKGRGRHAVPPVPGGNQGADPSAPDQQTDRFSNCPPSSTDKGGGLDQPSQRFDKDVPGGPIGPGGENAPAEPPPLLPPSGTQ